MFARTRARPYAGTARPPTEDTQPPKTPLAFSYDSGQGVLEDHVEAARWYRKAARQGDLEAEFNLGALDDIGQGVPVDHAEAAR